MTEKEWSMIVAALWRSGWRGRLVLFGVLAVAAVEVAVIWIVCRGMP